MSVNPLSRRYSLSVIPGFYASQPGIQLGTKLGPDAGEEEIAFVKQLGIELVTTYLPHPEDHIIPEQHPGYHRGVTGNLGLALFINGVRYAMAI